MQSNVREYLGQLAAGTVDGQRRARFGGSEQPAECRK